MKFVFIKKFITFLILINSHRYVQSSQLHLDSIFKLYDFLPNNHQKEFGFSFTSLSKNINYEGWLRISFETFLKSPTKIGHNKISRNDLIHKDPGTFRKNSFFNKTITDSPPTDDSFYFRLNNDTLYYTQTKHDMIVIGSVLLKSFKSINSKCVKINAQSQSSWTLCAKNYSQKHDFICSMLKSKGKQCSPIHKQTKIVEIDNIIEDQPILLYQTPSPVCNLNWNYKLHGDDWICICSQSETQSPIMIKKKYEKIREITVPAIFDFPIIPAKLLNIVLSPNSLKITCDGRKMNNCEELILAGIIDYDGTEYLGYELQFHFPNEHQIEEETYEMEIQILYKAVSPGDYNKKAGLAFLVKEKAGVKNLFLKKMNVLNLPLNINQKTNLADLNGINDISLSDILKFREEDLLNEKAFNYFSYIGSLTSPPCDEPVKWFIVEEPIEMGFADLETLKKTVLNSLTGQNEVLEDLEGWKDTEEIRKMNGNFRKTQPLKQRIIEYYKRENSPKAFG